VGSLLEVGSGFHGDLTGRENTYLNGAILGMRKAVIDRKFDEIIAFAEIERFIDTPVKHYSSGMYLRLAFAVAAHLEPEILLVDEVLAVGDASFQKKCLGKMEQVGAEGRTVLFVSHNMPAVLRLCDRAILLEQGSVTAEGPAPEIVRRYLRSDAGTSAERVWADPRTAPGDNCVRLKAVRVCRADGQVTETVDVREPVNVQIEYWNLDSRRRPSANIQVVNQDGIRLFVSADFNNREWRDRPRSPGVVKSTCCIPGSFLAEGQIFVTACVSSFDVSPPVGHVRERDLLAFHVVDQSDGDGARGSYGSIWPGVVRPLLDWTVQFTAMDITSGVS
jgi:lipopolysaccharide transport system ATP-binding protein